jgi:hypothetical protein
MDKRSKIILYLLLGILIALVFVDISRPQPINWRPSYTSGDKVPLGAYVLYDNLPTMFPESKISSVDQVPIDFLRSHEDEINANYFFLNDYLVFDETETDYLIKFAQRGNKVFISSATAYGALADSLKLEASNSSYYTYGASDTIRTRLINRSFQDRSYVYSKAGSYRYFESYDTLRTTVLGEVLAFNPESGYLEEMILGNDNYDDQIEKAAGSDDEVEEETDEELQYDFEEIDRQELLTRKTPQVNFVEIKIGDGAIYWNLNPIAYSNYYMLNGKEQYVAESLAYLNDGPIFFDDYGKSGRRVVSSPMRFVLSQVSLAWAYYIAIAAILLYMIFVSRREQRIVPVVEPLDNSTVEFTKTIGNLYFDKGDYTSIVNKKITFFLERVRTKYYLNTNELNQVFINRLALKSGRPMDQTKELIDYINQLKGQPLHNEHQLKLLNKRIEAFFKEK